MVRLGVLHHVNQPYAEESCDHAEMEVIDIVCEIYPKNFIHVEKEEQIVGLDETICGENFSGHHDQVGCF